MTKAEAEAKAKAFLSDRQKAYRKVFGSKRDRAVLAVKNDLSIFCQKYNSCFDPDPRIHAMYEGRREVILRVDQHLELDFESLWKLYQGG